VAAARFGSIFPVTVPVGHKVASRTGAERAKEPGLPDASHHGVAAIAYELTGHTTFWFNLPRIWQSAAGTSGLCRC
jgi:hypothetical protein